MILYKYYSVSEFSLRAISVRGLWCGMPSSMNDPLECLVGAPTSDQRLRDKLISRYAFCSLSEKPDDLLMWSHYADAHTGFVLGLEIPEDVDGHLLKVNYVENVAPIPIEALAILGNENRDKTPESKQALHDVLCNLSRKASCWKYEHEWRIWRKDARYYSYTTEQINDVYFGVRCNEETKLMVMKLFDGLDNDYLFKTMELKYNPIRLEA